MKREYIKYDTQAYNIIFKFKLGYYNLGLCLKMEKPKVLQKIEHVFSGSDYLKCQGYSPRPRGEFLPRQALSMGWVLAWSLALSSLKLPLTTIVDIVGRGKKITCTQKGIQSKA
jgi:hypothetical protein